MSTCIQYLRSNVEATFSQWFPEAETVAVVAGFEITMSRQSQIQTLRDKHPANNDDNYFRTSIAIPFLHHLLSQMNFCFQYGKLAADDLSLVTRISCRKQCQGLTPRLNGFSHWPPYGIQISMTIRHLKQNTPGGEH